MGGARLPRGLLGVPLGGLGSPWGGLGEPWGDLGGAKGYPQRQLLQKRRPCKIIGFIAEKITFWGQSQHQLCKLGELAGEGSVAVALGLSDPHHVTSDT